jgi:hypothetical protein
MRRTLLAVGVAVATGLAAACAEAPARVGARPGAATLSARLSEPGGLLRLAVVPRLVERRLLSVRAPLAPGDVTTLTVTLHRGVGGLPSPR